MSISSPEVLFIVLADELIGIDFKKLLNQPQWTHKVKTPNIAQIHFQISLLDLFKDRKEVVVGLTHMRRGSEVYLLGGERLKSGAKANKKYVNEHPESYGGFSRKVFQLIKKNKTFSLKRDTSMDQHYGKCSPMIANIGSKVYVLGGPSYLQNDHVTWGSFEVYNLCEEYWGILKDAPPYTPSNSSEPNGQILGHLVLGHKLLITSDTGKSYFFDTSAQNGWQELDNEAVRSFQKASLSIPTNGITVPFFPEFNNDLKLVLSREGFEEAYAIAIHVPTCSVVAYQCLREVFHDRYPVTEIGERVRFNGGRNFFLLLPNDQIFAMWVGFDHYKRLRLFITIFTLKVLHKPVASSVFQRQETTSSRAPETMFLATKVNHTFDCIVKDGISASHVFDAFFY